MHPILATQRSITSRGPHIRYQRQGLITYYTLHVQVPVVPVVRTARMPTVEARVSIRFTRIGRKQLPFYRIVAIDSRKRRDGAPLEYLGWYNPLSKETNLNAPAIKKWLETGAQPSDTVKNLLKKAMVIE